MAEPSDGQRMRTFLVMYDCEERYVEAPSFAVAIELWKAAMRIKWGADCDGTEEPESVALVSWDGVIRAPVRASRSFETAKATDVLLRALCVGAASFDAKCREFCFGGLRYTVLDRDWATLVECIGLKTLDDAIAAEVSRG